MVKPRVKDAITSALGDRTSKLDETILDYIGGVLEEDESMNLEDFNGIAAPFLMDAGIADSDENAESICKLILDKLGSMNLNNSGDIKKQDATTSVKLSGIVNMSKATVVKEEEVPDWAKITEKPSLVDSDRLEAKEQKKKKQRELKTQREDRDKEKQYSAMGATQFLPTVLHAASAGANPVNLSKDIHLENFDIAFGKDLLISSGTLTLSVGRRYGLVGRNGTGKSTLLRHIAHREIMGIPGHIRILHVEQEVTGDDTSALQAVLECDVEREKLMSDEKELQANASKYDPGYVGDRLRKIYERLQEIDAFGAEAKAASILSGLGFTTEGLTQPTKSFSGGWRMRIALARALFCQPDLLILDEPTNHLDLFSTLWLEGYLTQWKATILVVSHLREFLNGVATDIIHLNGNKKLDYYKGNYDSFENTRYERMRQQQKQFDSQQRRVKHVQSFIDRFRYNAKRASLVQSRLKALEKMQMVDEVANDPTLVIKFQEPPVITPPILQFNDASFGYSPENKLFHTLNMGVDMDSRIALVGANGVGKSTLMNLLAGELEPTDGTVIRNPKLRFARFSQHFVDQLKLDVSPVEHFMATYPGVSIQTARQHLGSFGLSGDIVLRTINTLSGGQKSRLVFAVLAWKQPHILLLDEPSNHLDLETIDSLSQALLEFKGGVLLISHDERLISLVCDEIWYFHDGTVEKFPGEFTDYKKMLLSQLNNPNANPLQQK